MDPNPKREESLFGLLGSLSPLCVTEYNTVKNEPLETKTYKVYKHGNEYRTIQEYRPVVHEYTKPPHEYNKPPDEYHKQPQPEYHPKQPQPMPGVPIGTCQRIMVKVL